MFTGRTFVDCNGPRAVHFWPTHIVSGGRYRSCKIRWTSDSGIRQGLPRNAPIWRLLIMFATVFVLMPSRDAACSTDNRTS